MTENENLNCTALNKMMFMQSYLVMGFLQESPPLFLQYLQHLIPATLQWHPFLWAHLPHVQGSGRLSGLASTISGTIVSFFSQNHATWSVFISKMASTPVVDNMLLDILSCIDPGEGGSLDVYFQGNVIKLSKSNVSRSVVGLRHFTRNVSAICITLSVSTKLLKLWIRHNFLWIAFNAASLVEILLVVSHPVSAWSADRHMSLSPSAVCISYGVTILIFSFLRLNCTDEEADDRMMFHVEDILSHRSGPTFMTLSLGDTMSLCVCYIIPV